ncbi:MAG: PBP1A family penicillin-binding protein [Patescibacteria group bacterium]
MFRSKLVLYTFGGIGAVALIFVFWGILIIKDLPNPELLENRQVAQSTKIYDRAGENLLYEIHGEEKRTVIPFEEIPEKIKQATIAIEDANFYNHSALDPRSILRALLVNLSRGRVSQGGSTITQQLAKNAFLSPDRTITRKIKELILAILLEKRYTKDEILNLYLNQIPYGSNAYGVEAASQTYFKKPAKDLNLAEAALLASLPKAPSYYSPWGSHFDELIVRKNNALDQMEKLGYISEAEKNRAKKHIFQFTQSNTGIKAPHFVIAVQEHLNKQYGEEFVRTAGLEVVTTLDWPMQELAEKVVSEGVKRNEELYKGTNAALVAEDASTGQVLALVGSRDYFDEVIQGNFNVATQGLRQPGSAIKPFVYLTAFQKGFTPDTVLFDVPTEFVSNEENCPSIVKPKIPEHDQSLIPQEEQDNCYHPQNFDEIFRGPITLRNALAQSINVPAVKALYLSGIDNVLEVVKNLGINTLTERSRYGLSLVLGGGEVKLVELVNAYSALAQEGVSRQQTMVLKVTDQSGKILEEYRDNSNQVIEPQYARLINDILSDVKARSPLFQNSLNLTVYPNHEVALKTGTTNDYRDAWAIGYTPSLVVGVWAGNNDNQPMQKKGGSILAAVPIWNSFLSEVLKNRPGEAFSKPEPIFVDKPILKGEVVVNNQIHDTLYYINKKNPLGPPPANPENDPQFKNWEEALVEWIKTNPQGQNLFTNLTFSGSLNLEIISPLKGSMAIGNFINVLARISSPSDIIKLEIFLNGKVISQQNGNFGKEYRYQNTIQTPLELQNVLKISAQDSQNNKIEKEVIFFKSS